MGNSLRTRRKGTDRRGKVDTARTEVAVTLDTGEAVANTKAGKIITEGEMINQEESSVAATIKDPPETTTSLATPAEDTILRGKTRTATLNPTEGSRSTLPHPMTTITSTLCLVHCLDELPIKIDHSLRSHQASEVKLRLNS